jgi:mono/diheme cytochrome c family protein
MRSLSMSHLVAIASAAVMIQGCSKEQPPPAATEPVAEVQPGSMSAESPGAVVSEAVLDPVTTEATSQAPAATAAASNEAGARVFKTYCETCHGAKGAGDGPASAALNPKPASFVTGAFKFDVNGNGVKGDVDDIRAIVRDGAAKHGGSPLMTPWSMLSATDLEAVTKHVKSLSGG